MQHGFNPRVGLGYIIGNSFDFFGHANLGIQSEIASIAKRYRVFVVVTSQEHDRYQKLEETTVIAPSNLIELFRPASSSLPVPRATLAPPAPPIITARITSPRHGAKIRRKIAVEGMITGLRPNHHVFLCLQSMAFGRLIYPQGTAIPGCHRAMDGREHLCHSQL